MILSIKKILSLLFVSLLVISCDVANDDTPSNPDTNITKDDAETLTAYNNIVSVNSGAEDVSDFYKIDLKNGDVVQFTASDNVNLNFEGDYTEPAADKKQMSADGTLYIEVKFLDSNNGTFTLNAFDPVLTDGLKTNFQTQKSDGSTITYNVDSNGYLVVESDMSTDPLEYPYAKLARYIKNVDLSGNVLSTNVDVTDLSSLVIEYESTHKIRLTLKDDFTNQVGFSYELQPTTSKTKIEIKLSDFTADSWAGDQSRTLDLNNVTEFTIGNIEKVQGNYTFYVFDAL